MHVDIIAVTIFMNGVLHMNRIRELRKLKGMKQKEVADYLQISASTLSYWEMGKYEPNIDALMKLSRFFKVSIDYIINGDYAKFDIDDDNDQSLGGNEAHITDSSLIVTEAIASYVKTLINDKINKIGIAGSKPDTPTLLSTIFSTAPAILPEIKNNTNETLAGFNRIEFDGLTQEEIDLLAIYAALIKYRKK